MLAAHGGFAPSARTLQRHFAAAGLTRSRPDGAPLAVFGRLEAERPNMRWVGDALHGPLVAGRKAILIAFLDLDATTPGPSLRPAGVMPRTRSRCARPSRSAWHRGAAPLTSMSITGPASSTSGCAGPARCSGSHSPTANPGKPDGRGKIVRFFRTVRNQFLVEIAAGPGSAGTCVRSLSLAELNSLFTAWVEQVYHQRVHTETGMPPRQRFLATGPPIPTPTALLTQAFRWGEWRTVTKTATVSLHGNHDEVDASLAGSKVELVFDPFDLSDIDVGHHDRPVGKAVPFRIFY